MFNRFENIPNKDNFNKPQNKVELNNFRNMEKQEKKGFDLIKSKLDLESIFNPSLKKEEIVINEAFGKDGYMVYETLASYNGNIDYIDEEDVKKYTNVKKLDSMSTVFIGSLSVIGLYMVYKIIKKTL